jgi:hypothetical protein
MMKTKNAKKLKKAPSLIQMENIPTPSMEEMGTFIKT